MATRQKTPQQIAEEQVKVEETTRREERIAELAGEEERRREEERRAEEKAAAREEAAAEATRLQERRRELEDRAEEAAEALKSALSELSEVDGDHRQQARLAGEKVPTFLHKGVVSAWLKTRLAAHMVGYGYDPGGTLPERDPMSSAERAPAKPFEPSVPGASLEDLDRAEEAARERATEQRRERLRRQYGREPLPREVEPGRGPGAA